MNILFQEWAVFRQSSFYSFPGPSISQGRWIETLWISSWGCVYHVLHVLHVDFMLTSHIGVWFWLDLAKKYTFLKGCWLWNTGTAHHVCWTFGLVVNVNKATVFFIKLFDWTSFCTFSKNLNWNVKKKKHLHEKRNMVTVWHNLHKKLCETKPEWMKLTGGYIIIGQLIMLNVVGTPIIYIHWNEPIKLEFMFEQGFCMHI